jgi:hypothetical protein
MWTLRIIICALCLVASLEAHADTPQCNQSDPVGLEILKDIPTNLLPIRLRGANAIAVIGRQSNAEYVSCVRRAEGIRNPAPWARITVYSKPVPVIAGLCRLEMARFHLSKGTWGRAQDPVEPEYAVAIAPKDCSGIDASKLTAVRNHIEDVALLRLLEYATRSGPLHQMPIAVGVEWRRNRVYYVLMYPAPGCNVRVFHVGGTAGGGFEVVEESTVC